MINWNNSAQSQFDKISNRRKAEYLWGYLWRHNTMNTVAFQMYNASGKEQSRMASEISVVSRAYGVDGSGGGRTSRESNGRRYNSVRDDGMHYLLYVEDFEAFVNKYTKPTFDVSIMDNFMLNRHKVNSKGKVFDTSEIPYKWIDASASKPKARTTATSNNKITSQNTPSWNDNQFQGTRRGSSGLYEQESSLARMTANIERSKADHSSETFRFAERYLMNRDYNHDLDVDDSLVRMNADIERSRVEPRSSFDSSLASHENNNQYQESDREFFARMYNSTLDESDNSDNSTEVLGQGALDRSTIDRIVQAGLTAVRNGHRSSSPDDLFRRPDNPFVGISYEKAVKFERARLGGGYGLSNNINPNFDTWEDMTSYINLRQENPFVGVDNEKAIRFERDKLCNGYGLSSNMCPDFDSWEIMSTYIDFRQNNPFRDRDLYLEIAFEEERMRRGLGNSPGYSTHI